MGTTRTKGRRTKPIDKPHMILRSKYCNSPTQTLQICQVHLESPQTVRSSDTNNELKNKVPAVDLPVTISLWRQCCEEIGVTICFVEMGLADVFTRKWRFLEGGGRPDSSGPGLRLSVPRIRVHCCMNTSIFLGRIEDSIHGLSFLVTVVFFCF